MRPTQTLCYFEKIFILNLPSRTDRKREMDLQLKAIGLSLDSPAVELFPAIRPVDKGPFDSVGARGCFMSHLGVLKKAFEESYARIVIFEDDLNLVEDFDARMEQSVHVLRTQPWEIFYGGYELQSEQRLTDGMTMVASDLAVRCTHFVAFNSVAISLAIPFLEALLSRPVGNILGGPMHVDGAYNWLRRSNPHLITRLAVPQLGYQRASRTDIHPLRWFDRLPVLRNAAARIRRLRNLLA